MKKGIGRTEKTCGVGNSAGTCLARVESFNGGQVGVRRQFATVRDYARLNRFGPLTNR